MASVLTAAMLTMAAAVADIYAGEDKWSLEIGLAKQTYTMFEPVWLDVTLTNITSDTQWTYGLACAPNQVGLYLDITDSNGNEVPYTGPQFQYSPASGPGYPFAAGEKDYGTYNLLEFFGLPSSESSYHLPFLRFPFMPTGAYTIQAHYEDASSNEGDTVLDPFCGCGTTIAAAERLHRQWIGIDVTFLAVALIKKRIKEQFPDCDFEVVGEPRSVDDARALFDQSPFQFESWAVTRVGGQPYRSTGGGDTGIDGYLYFQDYEKKYHKVIIEVKGGKYSPRDVRALAAVMSRENAPLGVLIAMKPPTRGMVREATLKGKWVLPGHDKEYPVLQIVTVDDLFNGKMPNLPDTAGTLRRAQQIMRAKDQRDLF